MQWNPQNQWKGIIFERSYADWILAMVVFFLVVFSFMG
jgi:hypothetical protein